MYSNKKIIAIIPARGGSKGLPGKNIRELNGKPLIAYSIEAALNSGVFDKVIVSTDSEEIAEVSKKFGAEIPFLRPLELATDKADSMDTLIHALKFYSDIGENFDYIIKLQPTSPLRTAEDIKEAVDLIIEKNGDAVISVSECKHHPLWTNTLNIDMKMNKFLKDEVKGKNRQELDKYYELNGMIFLSKAEKLIETRDWYGENSYAQIIDGSRAIDIDNIIDFKLAEIILKINLGVKEYNEI